MSPERSSGRATTMVIRGLRVEAWRSARGRDAHADGRSRTRGGKLPTRTTQHARVSFEDLD